MLPKAGLLGDPLAGSLVGDLPAGNTCGWLSAGIESSWRIVIALLESIRRRRLFHADDFQLGW